MQGHSAFAGRDLRLTTVFASPSPTPPYRNRAIAHLFARRWALRRRADEIVENDIAQCSVLVDGRDLAVIAATLAAGGRNPVTGRRVVSPDTVRDVLSVMAMAGYARRGWVTGLRRRTSAKSGVAGGGSPCSQASSASASSRRRSTIVVLGPRRPCLRGALTIAGPGHVRTCPPRPVARTADVHAGRADVQRQRDPAAAAQIAREGARARAFELQGDLGFAEAEQVTRAVIQPGRARRARLRRVRNIHEAALALPAGLARSISALSAAPTSSRE